MTKGLLYALVLIVLGALLGYLISNIRANRASTTEVETILVPETENTDAVKAYVVTNIAELSPEPEVLGGTFYVTSITAGNGSGTVSYEDGHNAYTADFTYSLGGEMVTITSFTVRP